MNSQIRTYDEAFPELPILQNPSSPRMQPIFPNRQHQFSQPSSRQFSATEAQRRIDQLEQELRREADMVDQLEASQLDLEREKRDNQDLIAHLTRSLEEKESQLQASELVIHELTESRDGLDFDNGLLQAKVERIKEKLKRSYDNFNEYHAECEHEFELAEEAKADQAEVIGMLVEEKAELQAQLQAVPQILQDMSDTFDDYYAECENELRVAEQANEHQAEIIEMLTNEKLALQAQLRDLQSQNNDLVSTNDRLNADRREELEVLEGQKKEQQHVINGLIDEKAVLTEQVKEVKESEKKAWELVHKRTALRRQENRDWLAETERAEEYSAALEEEIKKGQEEAAKLTEKIEQLRSEKLDVYDAWRGEVERLDEKIQKGEDANTVLKDQISILEKEVEEMIAQPMVSDVDNQDKIAAESGSTSTVRGSSPAIEAPGSPIYDVPGWTPIDDSEDDQPQTESGVFIRVDEHAVNKPVGECESDNNNSLTTSNNDVIDNIKGRRPSWGGPWEQETGKRGRGEEDDEVETWAEKAERRSRPENKRRRL